MKERITLGSFEVVSLPLLGMNREVAKVDTGAYSGALHCTGIKVVRRGENKTRILKYVPNDDMKLATETSDFKETYVRSATGHRLKRYIINTKIEIHGVSYNITIGLSDRSDLKRPILIGRRFLRENNFLVDVQTNQEYDDEWENSK